jgi:hypothetical protein
MPVTLHQWEESLRQPALCELLPVRDYVDDCIVRTNGSFVAGYSASGLNTFFHSDDTRNRTKEAIEALVRSLPERSMRMQVRNEVTEGHGDLPERYLREQSIENPVLQALDRERLRLWNVRQDQGQYLERHVSVFFVWNPDVHHENPEFQWRKARRNANKWSLAANKCIERSLGFAAVRIRRLLYNECCQQAEHSSPSISSRTRYAFMIALSATYSVPPCPARY